MERGEGAAEEGAAEGQDTTENVLRVEEKVGIYHI